MTFSPNCRTKKLGMIYIIFGRFAYFFNWEGVVIWHQIRPRKILGISFGSLLKVWESAFFIISVNRWQGILLYNS